MGIAVSIAVGLAVFGQAAAGDDAPRALRPGTAVTGEIAAEERAQLFPLASRQGDFVQGVIDVKGGPVDLDVVDRASRTLRRLAAKSAGRTTFLFIAGEGDALRLTASKEGASYSLEIVKQFAVTEQAPPPPTYLSPAVAAAAAAARDGKGTDAFWARIARDGTPLVEPSSDRMRIVTFLYRGASRNVRILGAPSADHDPLEHVDGTDIWFKTYLLPASTRLSYQIAPDIPEIPGTARERRVAILATAQADPLNRFPWPADASDRFNLSSTFALDGAPAQPFLAKRKVDKGKLVDFEIESPRLGNTRTITLYTPPHFSPARKDNVLLFLFDGDAYQSKVPTPTILDNMIADGAIPPVVAVLIPNPDREARGRELPDSADFTAFLADELLPAVAARTGLKPAPSRTILAGSSFGGLASVRIALARPDLFGNALSMSGSFWWHPDSAPAEDGEYIAALVARNPKAGIRVFLSAGLFEVKGPGADAGILDSNRHLRDVLQARDYEIHYREYAAGHDYLVWRGILSDGLIALFGRR
ncbi:enterochelin esterase [Rhizobium sp. FKL33]|uniref:enterochelin esterase n=1 Tax=Rhizobium sp. FKL33 TaxID=2562307 RepID=UPI001FEE845B|nr:enterochelin esterase [Rhizobium sp. FKL33]